MFSNAGEKTKAPTVGLLWGLKLLNSHAKSPRRGRVNRRSADQGVVAEVTSPQAEGPLEDKGLQLAAGPQVSRPQLA